MVVTRTYLTSFLVKTLYKITKDAKGTDPIIHDQYARRLQYRHTCQDVTCTSSVFQDGSDVTTMFLFISFFRMSSSISTEICSFSCRHKYTQTNLDVRTLVREDVTLSVM